MKYLFVNFFVAAIAGSVITLAITIVGSYTAAYTAPSGLSDVEVYVRALYTYLFIWYLVAAGTLVYHINKIKIDKLSLVLRQVLLWGPINIAWYFTTKGYDGILLLGMIASSAVLYYEAGVWSKTGPKR